MMMSMILDEPMADFDFSGYSTTVTVTTTSTTTNSTDDEHGCRRWNDWSPVVDWEALSGDHDDFHDLVDSIMEDAPVAGIHDSEAVLMEERDSVSPEPEEEVAAEVEESNGSEDSKGLRLVHLLMAAAEAMTGGNKNRELARVILVRLRQLVSPTGGTNMERLAAYFTEALHGLLEGAGGGVHGKQMGNNHRDDHHHVTDVLAAFQLLQDMSPYVKFGHFTANQAILEAVAHDRRIHIVDYDINEGIQWASFMQALMSRKEGPTSPNLRITALSRAGSGRRSIGTIQETGRRLTAFAASIGQPFSFHQCRLDSDETFKPSSLKMIRGEALVFNCMLHLPHFSYRASDSIASFLSGSKALNPRLVTLVEEEMGPTQGQGFVGQFMDTLHHYSAVYDSLEAGFPMQSGARVLVERVFLGPRIAGSLARIYRAREKEMESDEGSSWGEWLGAVGFNPVSISFANHCQAKLLLGLFNDGYRVEEVAHNNLVLGWKSKRLLSASVWTSLDSDFSII